MMMVIMIMIIIIIICPREYKSRGLKQEAINKISTVATGTDLRQDKMTPE